MKVVPLPACVPQDREIVDEDDALRVAITEVTIQRYYTLVKIFSCTNSQYIQPLVALKNQIPYIAKFSQIKISRRRLYKVDIKAFLLWISGAIASEMKQTKELHAVC